MSLQLKGLERDSPSNFKFNCWMGWESLIWNTWGQKCFRISVWFSDSGIYEYMVECFGMGPKPEHEVCSYFIYLSHPAWWLFYSMLIVLWPACLTGSDIGLSISVLCTCWRSSGLWSNWRCSACRETMYTEGTCGSRVLDHVNDQKNWHPERLQIF